MIQETLEPATLLRRYKRFLADVELSNGEQICVHCPNPGAMTGLAEPGTRVWLRRSADPRRKLALTWVLTELPQTYVTVDTLLANKLMDVALRGRVVPALADYGQVEREKTYLDSRFDFRLSESPGQPGNCFVEIKSTTLADASTAMFPDAPTERGRKHLEGLSAAVKAGFRAVQFYCAARSDVSVFRPADHIDPRYGELLRKSQQQGVELIAWSVDISRQEERFLWKMKEAIPVLLD